MSNMCGNRRDFKWVAARCQRAKNTTLTQGGARFARWPWADLRCTFGAKGKNNIQTSLGCCSEYHLQQLCLH
jgi:hypothetical protein